MLWMVMGMTGGGDKFKSLSTRCVISAGSGEAPLPSAARLTRASTSSRYVRLALIAVEISKPSNGRSAQDEYILSTPRNSSSFSSE